MADAIFISYRRDDSEGEAGRLFDDLVRAFGNDAVFMDVAGIKPGMDFRKAIEDNVASCGVFLAVIGPTWATIAGPDGKRRLEDPNDFVALEISSALKREVPVIPVLVHDARMPPADLLPDALKSFSYRNSVELSHARWNSDVVLLIEALKAYVTPSPSRQTGSEAPVHANVPVQLPAPHHPAGTAVPQPAKSKTPLFAGTAIAAVLVIAGIVYFATRTAPSPSPSPSPNQPTVIPTVAGVDGTWSRAGNLGDVDALGKLIIAGSGPGLTVHAFGRCQAASCDWGSQPGTVSGSNVVATFSAPPSGSDTSHTAVVTVHPVAGGLDVFVQNNFQNPAGPRANHSHQLFAGGQ